MQRQTVHDPGMDADAASVVEMLESKLRSARELLGMQIAWIAEFRSGQKVFRAIEGDGESFGFQRGQSLPLDTTYCQRVVAGKIPNAIPDTAAVDEVRDLDVTREARIGAYVGVPIELSDGTVFGTLCCASHDPVHSLSARDVRYLKGLSRRIALDLEDRQLETSGSP